MILSKQAQTYLSKLSGKYRQRVAAVLRRIATEPTCGKYLSALRLWSAKQGKLRIVYILDPLEVLRIAPRGEAYMGLPGHKGSGGNER